MRVYEKLAVRRFNEGVLAEEAVTFVLEALADNDWARCHAFQGKSKPSTFLYSLASNLIEEFARKRFGRPRPPSWLKEQGELWVRMWKYLCLERQDKVSVIERLSANGDRSQEFLENVARTIKARMPNCGLSAMDQTTVEDITSLSDAHSAASEQEDLGAGFAQQRSAGHEVALMLRAVLAGAPSEDDFSVQARAASSSLSDTLDHAQATLRDKLHLSAEERVLLKMIYADGMSKNRAAKAIGLAEHQGGRIVNAALQRLASVLTEAGLDLSDLFDEL